MVTLFIVIGIILLFVLVIVIVARRRIKSVEGIPDNTKIKILTDQNFKNQIKTGMVLVDFWASWCMPCKMMVPVLNDVAEEAGKKVLIGKVNVDEQKATASSFGIRSIPTMILFRNGKEIHRFTGVKTKEYILRELDRRSMN